MGNTAVWTLVLTFFGCIMMLWVFHRAPPSEVTANLHSPPTLANSPFVAVSHPSNGSSVGGPRHSCAPCANSSTLRRLLQVVRFRKPSAKRLHNEAEEEVCLPCLSPRKKGRSAPRRSTTAAGALTAPVVATAGGASTRSVDFQGLANQDTTTWTKQAVSAAQYQSPSAAAARMAISATRSLNKCGPDGSGSATEPLLKEKLAAAILFGTTFAGGPPYTEAHAISKEIGLIALSSTTPHMATAGGGASFTLPQDAPSLYFLTYPLPTDVNAVTSVFAYQQKGTVVDPRIHDFIDQYGEPCWTAKTVFASMMDAQRGRGYVTNALPAHSSADKQKEYIHGDTPTSDEYDNYSLFMVHLLRSGRFSDVSIQGKLGRDMLMRGIHLLGVDTGEHTWYCVSFDHDEVYQQVFGTEWLNAGMFHASDEEELLFFFSARMPHGVFVSLDSSTTDPFGSKRLLRSALANRQAFLQRLYGKATKMYGHKDSFVETLAQQHTMSAAESRFASFGVLGVEGKTQESPQWRVPASHAGVANGKARKRKEEEMDLPPGSLMFGGIGPKAAGSSGTIASSAATAAAAEVQADKKRLKTDPYKQLEAIYQSDNTATGHSTGSLNIRLKMTKKEVDNWFNNRRVSQKRADARAAAELLRSVQPSV